MERKLELPCLFAFGVVALVASLYFEAKIEERDQAWLEVKQVTLEEQDGKAVFEFAQKHGLQHEELCWTAESLEFVGYQQPLLNIYNRWSDRDYPRYEQWSDIPGAPAPQGPVPYDLAVLYE